MLLYNNYLLIHVAGQAMSGIAKILLAKGNKVYGWDDQIYENISDLKNAGLIFFTGKIPSNINTHVDCVIHSSLISSENVRNVFKLSANIIVLGLYDFINILVQDNESIAVAGSYGKTTTTSLLSHVFDSNGIDINIISGGILKKYDSNSKIGISNFWVIEATETHNNFLKLIPKFSIVLNIEHFFQIKNFESFINNTKNSCFINIDDIKLEKLYNTNPSKFKTFGIHNKYAMFRAKNICLTEENISFDFYAYQKCLGSIDVALIGEYNIYNILASCSFAYNSGISFKNISNCFNNYQGVVNRFEIKSQKQHIFIVDIAHHRKSIEESINACKLFNKYQTIVIYRPHMFEELNKFGFETEQALSKCDYIFMFDVKSLKDNKYQNINTQEYVMNIKRNKNKWVYIKDNESILQILPQYLNKPSVVLLMGMYIDNKLVEKLREYLQTI